jgi:hypothetical protein
LSNQMWIPWFHCKLYHQKLPQSAKEFVVDKNHVVYLQYCMFLKIFIALIATHALTPILASKANVDCIIYLKIFASTKLSWISSIYRSNWGQMQMCV